MSAEAAPAAAADANAAAAATANAAADPAAPASDKKGPRGSANLGKKKPSINTTVVDKGPSAAEEQADALLKKKRESQLKRQSMPEQLKQTLSDMKEKNAGK